MLYIYISYIASFSDEIIIKNTIGGYEVASKLATLYIFINKSSYLVKNRKETACCIIGNFIKLLLQIES